MNFVGVISMYYPPNHISLLTSFIISHEKEKVKYFSAVKKKLKIHFQIKDGKENDGYGRKKIKI